MDLSTFVYLFICYLLILLEYVSFDVAVEELCPMDRTRRELTWWKDEESGMYCVGGGGYFKRRSYLSFYCGCYRYLYIIGDQCHMVLYNDQS
jgi:hypothetical protein